VPIAMLATNSQHEIRNQIQISDKPYRKKHFLNISNVACSTENSNMKIIPPVQMQVPFDREQKQQDLHQT